MAFGRKSGGKMTDKTFHTPILSNPVAADAHAKMAINRAVSQGHSFADAVHIYGSPEIQKAVGKVKITPVPHNPFGDEE